MNKLKTLLTLAEVERLQELKTRILDRIDTMEKSSLEIASDLQEIKSKNLYRASGLSFKEFCYKEFNVKKSQTYRLLDAAAVKASLKKSPMGDSLKTERQARALVDVPVKERAAVLKEASKDGEPTAAKIEAAKEKLAPKPEPEPEPPVIELDKTGMVIPDLILADWKEAENLSVHAADLKRIRLAVKHGLDDNEIPYREISNTTLATLKNAEDDLRRLIPYAICPTCQGAQRKGCTTCKKRGYISEFLWDTAIDPKTKAMREKIVNKKK